MRLTVDGEVHLQDADDGERPEAGVSRRGLPNSERVVLPRDRDGAVGAAGISERSNWTKVRSRVALVELTLSAQHLLLRLSTRSTPNPPCTSRPSPCQAPM